MFGDYYWQDQRAEQQMEQFHDWHEKKIRWTLFSEINHIDSI